MKCDYKRTIGIDPAQRALIKSCAEHGVEIVDLGNGSTFRFIPAIIEPSPAAPPSSRGSFTPKCRKPGCPCRKARTWKPEKLSLAPQYKVRMRGDPLGLTVARAAWADGDAKELIDYLAEHKGRVHG